MLAIRIGDEDRVLSDESAAELIRRLPPPPLEGGEPLSESLEGKLREALETDEPALLEPGELALLGGTIEAWATELGVDAADVQQVRDAIAAELG